MNKEKNFWSKHKSVLLTAGLAALTVVVVYALGLFGAEESFLSLATVAVAGTGSVTGNETSVEGVAGTGTHIGDQVLTTTITREKAEDLLLNDIDKRIVKIRPASTPIDQITRHFTAQKADAQIVEYYSIDTKPNSAKTTKAIEITAAAANGGAVVNLSTDNNESFAISDTVLIRGIAGSNGNDCMLYVHDIKQEDKSLLCTIVNGTVSGSNIGLPAIPLNTEVKRMARAANELDIQTPQYEALPDKAMNYCQIYKAQVEQSTFQKMTKKEVSWDFNDLEEASVYDMRMGIEKTFLFGSRGHIKEKKEGKSVYTTGGIWWEIGKDFEVDHANFDKEQLISLLKSVFTGNSGNKQRVLFAGSDLIETLTNITYDKTISATETKVEWGIEFTKLRSNFGTLLVLHHEIFTEMGMSGYGMVIDPEYIDKKVFLPMGTQTLDLKTSGQRNSDAVVITEASCLALRYPDAHCRIVPKQ